MRVIIKSIYKNGVIKMSTLLETNYLAGTADSIAFQAEGALQVRNDNVRVIDGLKAEFGAAVARQVWERIAPNFRELFESGEKSLAPFEEQLKAQGHGILCDQVKERHVDLIQQSTLSIDTINEWLQHSDNNTLVSYAQQPQVFSQALQIVAEEARVRIEQEMSTAKENTRVLNLLKDAYSSEIVVQVYQLIPETKREELETGKISIKPYLSSIHAKCTELYQQTSTVGVLPEGEELRAFLRTAKVERFAGGYNGAFFITGIHNQQPFTIVVKAPDKPAQEFFANTLYPQLHIPTPVTQLMGLKRDKETAVALKKVLEESTLFKEKYPKKCPTSFLVMSCVPGCTLEKWKAADILDQQKEEPYDAIYDKVLFDIGQIAGTDFLLYYRDRLPTIGMGNLANLMILKDEQEKCIGAVAIDQVAYLTQDFQQKDIMGTNPFERIEEIVTAMMQDPSAISKEAQAIFDSALPDDVKQHLDEQRALAAIQKGIIAGLSKVSLLGSPELLSELHQSLPKPANSRDGVDLGAHQMMHAKIQGCVLNK